MITEETKLLGEALSTVKIQVQQMKRHLVCHSIDTTTLSSRVRATRMTDPLLGIRLAYGRAEERKPHAR
jgi:hypothetical protein